MVLDGSLCFLVVMCGYWWFLNVGFVSSCFLVFFLFFIVLFMLIMDGFLWFFVVLGGT